MSVTQSPPSASITPTSRNTRPGSCAERRSRVPANASDNAAVNPTRSVNSTSNATPACDTSPAPSDVTSTVSRRASGFTNWVSSWVGIRILSNPNSHGPGGRSQDPTSAHYWRFEVNRSRWLDVDRRAAERSAIGYFKQQARGELSDPPDNLNLLGWLALMQHYGAPTRLLDWTDRKSV